MPLGLPPQLPREGSDSLRSLAHLADVHDRLRAELGQSVTTVYARDVATLSMWRALLDGHAWTPPSAPILSLTGTFGLLTFEVRIPRGTPAFTAYLDRGWGLAHAAANNTTGVAGA